MTEITCLRCKTTLDQSAEACPQCGEKVTHFQRTYSTRLLDGKYQILERLGVGGMGEIFKVRHIHLNEQRVVKIMRSNIATDEGALQRFLHEARLATMIKHRNLAMLYDFSTLDDGSYYMVWEYIEGTNIQKWIALNGPVPPRVALEVAIQALGGLEALHQMGIIHRDISPENIMLSQDHMGKLLVKVIDFGIAKQLSDEAGGQGLTQTGMFLGKLKYASPEQAGFIKEGEQLDARSDLYSFGVVFYEMLAGRAPFVATNPHGYILKHATEKPPRIAETNPDTRVPVNLEAVVFRVLEKDRETRHVNAAELIRDLEELRSEIPPEEKFGLGEKMVTISSRVTAMDLTAGLSSRTPSRGTLSSDRTVMDTQGGAGGTVAGGSMERTAMSSGGGESTVMDSRGGTAPAPDATMVERMTGGSTDATVVERRGPAAPYEPTIVGSFSADSSPTVMEPRMPGLAGPTVVDRVPAKRTGMIVGGIAAAVLIAAVAGWMLTRDSADSDLTPGTTTDVTGTAPIPSDDAIIQLSSLGTLESIVDSTTNQELKLTESDPTTPLRLSVPPGSYKVTVRSPDDRTHTLDVTVAAGDVRPLNWPGRPLDYDQIAKDILQQ